VLYEPRVTRDVHPRAGLECVAAGTHNLTPDIVLVAPRGVVLMDAKYRTSPPRDLLADAVLKYLHGLRSVAGPVLGLHLLFHAAGAETVDYHVTAVAPAVTLTPAHPANPGPLARVLARHLE
jgi:hypothetical protein